jgi:hypothetical protein
MRLAAIGAQPDERVFTGHKDFVGIDRLLAHAVSP